MLIRFESFNHYATADLASKFTQVGAPVGPASGASQTIAAVGPRGTNGLRQVGVGQQSSGFVAHVPNPAPSSAVCLVGFLFRCVSAFALELASTSDGVCLFACRRSSASQWFARLNQNGTISFLRGSTILATTTTALLQNTPQYLEFAVLISPSAGTIDCRIDGVDAMPQATGLNTQGAGVGGWDEYRFGAAANKDTAANTVEHQFADVYVFDGSGTVCNGFAGPIRVDVLLPTADGAHGDFAPSTGTSRFATVDDPVANGDTDYNASGAVGAIDTLRFPAAPVANAPIVGLQVVTQARKETTGSATQQAIARLGTTDYAVGGRAIPTTYAFLVDPIALKPSDGSPWLPADIASSEFGYKKSG